MSVGERCRCNERVYLHADAVTPRYRTQGRGTTVARYRRVINLLKRSTGTTVCICLSRLRIKMRPPRTCRGRFLFVEDPLEKLFCQEGANPGAPESTGLSWLLFKPKLRLVIF
jgi:hypothetical protein